MAFSVQAFDPEEMVSYPKQTTPCNYPPTRYAKKEKYSGERQKPTLLRSEGRGVFASSSDPVWDLGQESGDPDAHRIRRSLRYV